MEKKLNKLKDDTVESGICESMTGYKKKYHVEIIPPTCQIHFILEATTIIYLLRKKLKTNYVHTLAILIEWK